MLLRFNAVCRIENNLLELGNFKSLWHRRYSSEFLPDAESIEEYFFYTALQLVSDGLVDRISDYPGYNFFHDAISGIKRTFKILLRLSIKTYARKA